MSKKFHVTLSDIQKAKLELDKHLTPTPLLTNARLSERFGCKLFLKLENMQPIGSFKIRGATYRISRLTREQRRKGVICASAGNHAQGVAWGSARYGVSALIVMPKEAALIKVENTKALGAEVRLEGANFQEAMTTAQTLARKTGRTLIHAFEDPDIIAGQGTLGLEIVDQCPDVDAILTSMGGGGLISGIATAVKSLKPDTLLVGCQAAGAAAIAESLKKGRAVQLPSVNTFADGIAIGKASAPVLKIIREHVDRVAVADDEEIAAAVLALMEKAKTVAEGSGALPLAILEREKKKFRGKKVVVVVGGGNIDVNLLARIIDRGLIRAGRRLRVNVLISDRPGSLMRLTQLIASHGVNVIQAIHDRSEPSTRIDQTDVALTLETKGPAHSREIIQALKSHVVKLELIH